MKAWDSNVDTVLRDDNIKRMYCLLGKVKNTKKISQLKKKKINIYIYIQGTWQLLREKLNQKDK
jgi:hypothetical protein